MTLYGIDFTSAPRKSKAITVAIGELAATSLSVNAVSRFESFEAFERFLQTPAPWIGGFDFPFGLPRELVQTLDWPEDWQLLLKHVRAIGKEAFKQSLNEVRQSRPVGQKYIERRGDTRADSSSPMKLVNPPVALMFFEGAPRLATAGVSVMPCAPNADLRIALEAYPGFLARQITRESYKKDGREGNTPKRIATRKLILHSLFSFVQERYAFGLEVNKSLQEDCVSDGSGDTLDAVLCCVQAAAAAMEHTSGDQRFGIPSSADDFEGWIATVK